MPDKTILEWSKRTIRRASGSDCPSYTKIMDPEIREYLTDNPRGPRGI